MNGEQQWAAAELSPEATRTARRPIPAYSDVDTLISFRVTHETEFSAMFETSVTLEDGQIVGIGNAVAESRQEVEV